MFYKGNTSCIHGEYNLYSAGIHFVFAVNTVSKQLYLKGISYVVDFLNSIKSAKICIAMYSYV